MIIFLLSILYISFFTIDNINVIIIANDTTANITARARQS